MIQSIYLHKEVTSVLQCFGNLSDVVNRVLKAGADGYIDIMDKPVCPNREGAARYEIDITEPYYLELLSTYSPFSSKISLRRLLYWFVENEVYADLAWEQTSEYVDKKLQMFNKKIANALNEMERAVSYAPTKAKTETLNIVNKIKSLQEYMNNGN